MNAWASALLFSGGVRGGRIFKRYDAKNGKTPPPGFEPTQDPDPVTGHWPGWVPVGDNHMGRTTEGRAVWWVWFHPLAYRSGR